MELRTGNAVSAGASRTMHVPVEFLHALGSARTEREVIDIYSAWSRDMLGADRSSIALPVGDTSLRVLAVHGRDNAERETLYPISSTLLGEVYRTSRSRITADLATARYDGCQTLHAMGLRSLIMVPLSRGDQCFGVITVAFGQTDLSLPVCKEMLEAVASCLVAQLFSIKEMNRLMQAATTDALTNARNRHFFRDEVKLKWTAWRDDGVPFSLALLDIDHFKKINDTFGHEVGDVVLSTVVRRVQRQARRSDSIVRMGGEEFCVILDGAGSDASAPSARRFWQAIRETPIVAGDHTIPLSACIGVAHAEYGDDSYNCVMRRADKALYQAKESGRDRVIVAQGDSMMPLAA